MLMLGVSASDRACLGPWYPRNSAQTAIPPFGSLQQPVADTLVVLLLIADITQAAALTAAATGVIAAIAGLVNLRLAILRERPGLAVFMREWRAGPQGIEHYIEVVTTNVARRPISVVSMGIELDAAPRVWRVSNGGASRDLPARLEDGETVAMTWLRDELGPEFYEGTARIAKCFAVDGRGKEVQAKPRH